jgi:hypothetical protein
MPTNTYVALATQVLTSAQQSITFSSIPVTYTDLRIVVANAKATNTARNVFIRVGNGSVDTGSNYSYTNLGARALSSTPFSVRESSQTSGKLSWYTAMTTAQAQMSLIDVMNYSNTTTFKTMLCSTRVAEGDGTYSGVEDLATLWRSTSAINTISIFTDIADTFQAGTTFTIYGIAATSAGAKATGGTIFSDSQYYYHAFLGNGTFTPTQSISADVLMVAGGGGGGSGNVGGGGGAGGLLNLASQSLTATNYTVTVGGGGAGRVGDGNATNGVNSSFGGLTAAVGGGAGTSGASFVNGVAGGSGGGAWTFGGIGGAGTSGQGFAGGNGSAAVSPFPSGGGGGAGAAGTSATSTASGPGGIGSSTYNSWGAATGIGQNVSGTYYLAGGGGGGASTQGATLGAGGLGGGGAGGGSGAGANGLTNTGGGAGGGGNSASFSGGTGGSGVVIVRYLKA